MDFYPFGRSSPIGLDIQSDTFRFVELKKNRESYILKRFGAQSLASGIFAEGRLHQWEILQSQLHDFVESNDLTNKSVAINLPINLVHMQKIKIPKGLLFAEIEAEISGYLHQNLPELTDALSIDFHEIPIPHSDQSQVVFAAVRKEFLFQYTECVNQCGLKVKIVDVDICALRRSVMLALQLSQMPLTINTVVHIVNDLATLIIYSHLEIIFYQRWDINENASFCLQLKTRIDLFHASFREVSVEKIAICGMPYRNLMNDLYHLEGYELFYPNLFSNMEVPSNFQSRQADDFLIASGLALRVAPAW